MWGAVYLCWVLVTTSWALHLMVLGLGLCLLSYLRYSGELTLVLAKQMQKINRTSTSIKTQL